MPYYVSYMFYMSYISDRSPLYPVTPNKRTLQLYTYNAGGDDDNSFLISRFLSAEKTVYTMYSDYTLCIIKVNENDVYCSIFTVDYIINICVCD